MVRPLADVMRPASIDDVVGQHHIIGENKILTNIIQNGDIPNMVFFGPSGTGKTTVANICASVSDKKLFKLNATNASTKDIKDIVKIKLSKFENRLSEMGINVMLDRDDIINIIMKKIEPKEGVRQIDRILSDILEKPLIMLKLK